MAFSLDMNDFEKVVGSLCDQLKDSVVPVAKMGVYDAAGIFADAVREELDAAIKGPSSGDLAASLGIDTIKDAGGQVSTVVGFAGYDSKGVPNPLKARVLNSGRSDSPSRKTRFMAKAFRRAKVPAEQAADKTIRDELARRADQT